MSSAAGFARGLKTGATSVFGAVIFGTYVGYGALCHDLGFTLPWSLISTVIVWAGPAQVILVTTLGSGAPLAEVAVAVSLTAMRFLPMVAALLPVIKTPATRVWNLLLPAHFTAASMWVEGLRVAPTLPREARVAFCNGLGCMMMAHALAGSVVGFALAAKLPPLLAAAVLFLTPLSFLMSLARNSRQLIDRLALILGLVLTPILMYQQVGLALLIGGLVAGTISYAAHRVRRGR
jgi:predicted branched-subunit amino acid permease